MKNVFLFPVLLFFAFAAAGCDDAANPLDGSQEAAQQVERAATKYDGSLPQPGLQVGRVCRDKPDYV